MKVICGFLGAFLVLGSVGSLEHNSMDIHESLFFIISGMSLILYAFKDFDPDNYQ